MAKPDRVRLAGDAPSAATAGAERKPMISCRLLSQLQLHAAHQLKRLGSSCARLLGRASGRHRDGSDIIVMAMGTMLGITCALFPWYIFYNQDQFGVREFPFEGGNGARDEIGSVAPQPGRIGAPFKHSELPRLELDIISTGTLAPPGAARDAIADQPFPGDTPRFQLLHVANGRAMIGDDTGLWVVQPGSRLPDGSRLKAIEQHDGGWVIITSRGRTISLNR